MIDSLNMQAARIRFGSVQNFSALNQHFWNGASFIWINLHSLWWAEIQKSVSPPLLPSLCLCVSGGLDRYSRVQGQRHEFIRRCKHIEETQTRSHFVFLILMIVCGVWIDILLFFNNISMWISTSHYQKVKTVSCLQGVNSMRAPRGIMSNRL